VEQGELTEWGDGYTGPESVSHLEPGQTRLVRLEVESKATSIWEPSNGTIPTATRGCAPGSRRTGAFRAPVPG